jgi:hypothetical protein
LFVDWLFDVCSLDQITASLFNGRTVALPAALPTLATALRQRMGGHRWGRRSGQNATATVRAVSMQLICF